MDKNKLESMQSYFIKGFFNIGLKPQYKERLFCGYCCEELPEGTDPITDVCDKCEKDLDAWELENKQ